MPELTEYQKLELRETRLLKMLQDPVIFDFVAEFLRRKVTECRDMMSHIEAGKKFSRSLDRGEAESNAII